MPKLTKRTVETLAARDSDYFVFDDELPGFGVRVLPSGRKTFLVQYRAGGRTRRVKIGVFGTVTADEARKAARGYLGDVAHGANPAEAVYQDRKSPTLSYICDRFIDDHVAHRCKPTTQRDYQACIDLYIKPALGTRKIGDVIRADIAQLHHDMRHKPSQANRALAVLSKLFNLVEVWGLRPDGSNPCRHVHKYPEEKRERYLSADEVSCLAATLDAVEAEGSETAAAVNAFRLLLLTGCRLREIQTLKWDYVSPPYLLLPDSKTGARKIPIDDAVGDVLDRIERVPDNPYVIVGKLPGQHLTDLQHPWRRIRKRAGLEGVRIHDLRHTYASHAISNGLPIEMVGKLLGHTQMQTTMRYAHLVDEPVRAAASRVASGLSGLMKRSGPSDDPPTTDASSGNIVQFPKVRAS